MTETQAKSGTAGTSATPVDEEAADGGPPATGRAVVGRAAVPADAPSPKFTRAPGMAPPPDHPGAERDGKGAADPAGGQGGGAPRGGAAEAVMTGTPQTTAGDGRAAGGTQTRPQSAQARTTVAGQPPIGRPGGGLGGTAAVGAARVTEAVRAARTTVASAASRGPRRARLNLKRVDPWSVMKFSFAVSLVLFIVVVVATSVLYLALDQMGVFESVNSNLTDLISAGGSQGGDGFKITAWGVIGTSLVIGAINVVLFTALATLGAFIYNVCADLVGGIEVTLSERD